MAQVERRVVKAKDTESITLQLSHHHKIKTLIQFLNHHLHLLQQIKNLPLLLKINLALLIYLFQHFRIPMFKVRVLQE